MTEPLLFPEPPPPPTAITLSLDYHGQPIRMAGTADRPEWVAADVGRVLGLVKVRNTVAAFDDDERSAVARDVTAHTVGGQGAQPSGTLGDERTLLTVTEPGLYRLIFLSRKPEAKVFRRWVMHDVLPSIRKHGCYPPPQPVPAVANRRPPGRPRKAVGAPVTSTIRVPSLAPPSGPWLGSIDLMNEKLISLREARNHPLLRLSGDRVPVFCTVLRYVQVGIRGVKLDAATKPSGLFTSEMAIVRFVERLSVAAAPAMVRPETPAQRSTAIQRADAILTAAGR